MTASSAIAIAATVVAGSIVGTLQWQARQNVVTAGFWFADVTFELPAAARIGGPLTDRERDTIASVARAEVANAFSGLRITLVDNGHAFYRVRVVQLLTLWKRAPLSGQSNVFGPLGGTGAVSFVTLASQAISHAPPNTNRAAIVEGIGRGIGRAAVHEFVHQILPHVPIHATEDNQSYEFRAANRPSQFYGPMRWGMAHPFLIKRLGPVDNDVSVQDSVDNGVSVQ
jgi:hypothetical protein